MDNPFKLFTVPPVPQMPAAPAPGHNRWDGKPSHRDKGDALHEYLHRLGLARRIRRRWRLRHEIAGRNLLETRAIRIMRPRRWNARKAAMAGLLGFCAGVMLNGWLGWALWHWRG